VPAFAPKGKIDIERFLKGEVGNDETPYAEWYQNSMRIFGSSVHRYHLGTYGISFPYRAFAPQFNQAIQHWDPGLWADLFSQAGAKYVVLVSKHHDGFLMWDSHHPNPCIPNWQADRDIAGELTEAVNARGMKMGFYYSSLLDWTYTRQPIVTVEQLIVGSDVSKAYRDYVEKHWFELIERYDPWILWGDIGYPPGYHLPKLFAHFYNRQSEGVVNDRWMQLPKFMFSRLGRYLISKVVKHMEMSEPPKAPHYDFTTPEYATLDYIATDKWETCRGIGNSFGYNQFEDASDYQKGSDLIRLLADIVSKNGNLLLNVGPRADGSIHPAQKAALKDLGAWLNVNGEAIYETRPWKRFMDKCKNGGELRYTTKDNLIYGIVVRDPATNKLSLTHTIDGPVQLLATGEMLVTEKINENLTVQLPESIQKNSFPVIQFKVKED
jgi:alpha-L-fucosidase